MKKEKEKSEKKIRRALGRPKLLIETKKFLVALEPEDADWAKGRAEGLGPLLRRLLKEERKRVEGK